MPDKRETIALRIARTLAARGHRALFAGGWVRDRVLGINELGDIDIATSATPEQVTGLFPHVVGVGAHFGVVLVIENGIPFEVATFRADGHYADGRHPEGVVFSDPGADAMRRDFTINGLFYDPDRGETIDHVDGIKDLERGIIRAIGVPSERFAEDYLRLLRAVRFAARFSFEIEPLTWEALCASAEGIDRIARERIFQEFDKMLTGPNPHRAADLLVQSGLMTRIVPEVGDLAGLEQPPEFHPEGDVLTHTLTALSFLQRRSSTVAWATLLHDVGKATTKTVTDRIRFNNHHRVGARLASKILGRLRAPRRLTDDVFECVDNHMNFMNVTRMRLGTLKKFLSRSTIDDEIELHRVDCLASHGDLSNLDFIAARRAALATEELKPEPLLRGRDLIAMGLEPGPAFGRMLRAVYDLQLDEEITTAPQARAWIADHRSDFAS